MMQIMSISDIQKKITPVLRSHGIKRASVFGSHARGTNRPGSDVDLLVQFGKPVGMIGYMRFVQEVEGALQCPVDVVTEKSLSKHLKPHIERDLQTIYES